tara:strand:+ start:159 stop:749 length:591 start_codon:yes stop_codon:yes gene_type:complete
MDKDHWEKYYQKNNKPFKPSDFSKEVKNQVQTNHSLIDIGCGNGRDSIFFARNKLITKGIDQSEITIKNLKNFENKMLQFECVDILNLENKSYDYGYCRFLLHSISEKEENYLLGWLKDNINKKIFLESRLDEGKNEKQDHYRRPMNLEKFHSKLSKLNIKILDERKSKKFSIYNDSYNVSDLKSDPLLVRMVLVT